MLIDKALVEIIAGNGGDGAIAFRREACVDKGGPSGGDGGRGGSVIFVGDNNVNTLIDFKYKRKIKAPDGENGKTKKCYGRKGDDIIRQQKILVPGVEVIFLEFAHFILGVTLLIVQLTQAECNGFRHIQRQLVVDHFSSSFSLAMAVR